MSDIDDYEMGFTEDLPPEFCRYKDEGCELSDSCLECPFPHCIYEEHGGRRRWLKQGRDKEIHRLFTSEGKVAGELAALFGVSRRTIQRALKKPLPVLPGNIEAGVTSGENKA
ncbi:hypothetical protein ACFLV2_00875 [Chloroflexota bacterium]